MEIRIGIEKDLVKENRYRTYFWIKSQGFNIGCSKKKKAKWKLKMLEIALLNIPGVTIKRIKGTDFYGGI